MRSAGQDNQEGLERESEVTASNCHQLVEEIESRKVTSNQEEPSLSISDSTRPRNNVNNEASADSQLQRQSNNDQTMQLHSVDVTLSEATTSRCSLGDDRVPQTGSLEASVTKGHDFTVTMDSGPVQAQDSHNIPNNDLPNNVPNDDHLPDM